MTDSSMRAQDLLLAKLRQLPPKPSDDAEQSAKKRYSEQLSHAVANAVAGSLRARGLQGARPEEDRAEAAGERRMAGGIGAKKMDVTWASEEDGLLLACSIKSINFKDKRSKNFQKNLTNRRGDMLFESVTLHRRFPFAVLVGMFFLDHMAAADDTDNRRSTFANAHHRFSIFSGRDDPEGREEQYEAIYIVLLDADADPPRADIYAVGKPDEALDLDAVIERTLPIVAERNPDTFEFIDGELRKL